jgi:crotonobetainyl-CoA:carnitine CoA-transferase CaiB-like acyl-CoA transferase
MLPNPIKLIGEELPPPSKAPTAGEHTEEILREVLGYDEERIAALRAANALG